MPILLFAYDNSATVEQKNSEHDTRPLSEWCTIKQCVKTHDACINSFIPWNQFQNLVQRITGG